MKKVFVLFLLCCATLLNAQSEENHIVTKGYHGTASVGGGYGFRRFSGYISMQTVHGYQFNPYIFVGGGASVDIDFRTDNAFKPMASLPIFGDVRFDAPVNKSAPFIELKLGASIPLGISSKGYYVGGVYFSPSLGVLFEITDKYCAGVAVEYILTQGKWNLRGDKVKEPSLFNYLGGRLFFGF